MPKIVHITNFESRNELDGGTHREAALFAYLSEQGAMHLVVQDKSFTGSKIAKAARVFRLIRQVVDAKPDIVVLQYPSYPFFWQFKINGYFGISVTFARLLRKAADKHGFRVVIDVMDLPAFQYRDLGFSLEMSPDKLKAFDQFIFRSADHIWVCSTSLTDLMAETYGIERKSLTTALNGYRVEHNTIPKTDDVIRFAYAGSLNKEREVGSAIDQFLAAGLVNAELHLCGSSGDWITESYNDPRLVYHGSLTSDQAAEVVKRCDIGLLPYPERGYYNLAFATKLPFYMGLGLPVLCSNAKETANHVRRLGVGLCYPLSEFRAGFAQLAANPQEVAQMRKQVTATREEFKWSNIYSAALAASLLSFDTVKATER